MKGLSIQLPSAYVGNIDLEKDMLVEDENTPAAVWYDDEEDGKERDVDVWTFLFYFFLSCSVDGVVLHCFAF